MDVSEAMKDKVIDVVDDDEAVRLATSLLLRSLGLRTRAFASAGEYLAALSNNGVSDCLLLDLNMPEMNGAELLERLAQGQRNMPVIIITGHRDPALTARARNAGALAVLDKPFGDEQLRDTISHALAEARDCN